MLLQLVVQSLEVQDCFSLLSNLVVESLIGFDDVAKVSIQRWDN